MKFGFLCTCSLLETRFVHTLILISTRSYFLCMWQRVWQNISVIIVLSVRKGKNMVAEFNVWTWYQTKSKLVNAYHTFVIDICFKCLNFSRCYFCFPPLSLRIFFVLSFWTEMSNLRCCCGILLRAEPQFISLWL